MNWLRNTGSACLERRRSSRVGGTSMQAKSVLAHQWAIPQIFRDRLEATRLAASARWVPDRAIRWKQGEVSVAAEIRKRHFFD